MVLVCVSAKSVESDKWELIGTSPAVSLEKFVICVCERAEETEAWNWAMQAVYRLAKAPPGAGCFMLFLQH